mmetsp:Transcript_59036/g.129618  ORF Transcript_59036/g.129618 Transcript_59036/m.129618 type:complete len:491 (-) Transcript_59036:349-1821(-)
MAVDVGEGLTQRRSGACCQKEQEADKTLPDADDGTSQASTADEGIRTAPVWSSGVPFYPPSAKYWRIGGKWYDFTTFLDRHPGGSEVLLLSRDRFEDCTFVFEAHHHNYQKVRAIIRKYEVPEERVRKEGLRVRPKPNEQDPKRPAHQDKSLNSGEVVKLLDDNAFYSVLRRRVTDYLRKIGYPQGGPTLQCKCLFWANFTAWGLSWFGTWYTGRFLWAAGTGIVSAWLGAFGHNWCHQPNYKFWAYLSLDCVGFSSDGWYREHNLQHHMYTNTPWDNHFKGTDPFLITDPTVERNFLQRWILPYVNPVILMFGLYGNYIAHTVELLKGNEKFAVSKLLFPLQIGAMLKRWGLIKGAGLILTLNGFLGVYYFSVALMNHNAEHCMDVKVRNSSRDWAVAQLNSSADWGVQDSFLVAARWLWLNYHTVHHLFPLIDFSHHPAVQAILMDTCEEFGVHYRAGTAKNIYKEMVNSFASPLSLMQECVVYAGGL